MAPDKVRVRKPDTSRPLAKRSNYLTVTEEPQLVAIDKVEEIDDTEERIDPKTGQIKKLVRVHCRQILLKRDKDASGEEEDIFEFFPQEEVLIKDSNSTSSWYTLTDFRKASKWPKEGVFFHVWKNPAPEGIRWEELA